METKRLIIVAVGGQGNLLSSRILGEAALLSDVPVRMSEIHGMAQRGGVVESAIVFGNAKSTIISDGEADLLVGFEPLETMRALNRCNANTTVITSISPLSPFTVTIGRGTYPKLSKIKEMISAKAKKLIAYDAAAVAKEAGSVLSVNVVLLGSLIQTEILPISVDAVKEAIQKRVKPAFVDMNLKAFELGFNVAAESGK